MAQVQGKALKHKQIQFCLATFMKFFTFGLNHRHVKMFQRLFSVLRTSVSMFSTSMTASQTARTMTAVLDQKNYIEELNRHLNATVANLQVKEGRHVSLYNHRKRN